MMDRELLEYGIMRYGTPAYFFDLDEMRKTVRNLRKKLGGRTGLCFAMKANPFLTGRIAAEVDRIEVCSMGEYEICRALDIPKNKLLISGVLKTKEELEHILEECRGMCAYTIESPNQFQLLAGWCHENRESLPVYLRLTSGNQFGMDEETIKIFLELRGLYPFLSVRGIHYFTGTQKRTAKQIEEELAYLDAFCTGLEETYSFTVQELEYGPGLAVSYFEGQKDVARQDLWKLAAAIDRMQWKGSLTLELGRALAAECGTYLTTVRDMKRTGDRNYCIVDGGIHQLHYDGQICGMYQPIFQVSPARKAGTGLAWTVCGSLCTANDVLMQKAVISDLRLGDVLIFARAGAYAVTEGMALFLSHAFPKIVLYSREKGWELVRGACETYPHNMERKIKDGNVTEYFDRG